MFEGVCYQHTPSTLPEYRLPHKSTTAESHYHSLYHLTSHVPKQAHNMSTDTTSTYLNQPNSFLFLPHSYSNSTIPPSHDHIYSICSVHTCTLGGPTTWSLHDGIDRPYPTLTTPSNTHDDGVDTNIPIP